MTAVSPASESVRSEQPVEQPNPCLFCGGTEYRPFISGVRDRAAMAPGEFTFLRCVRCDSAMLTPTPRAEDLPGYYPEVYSFAPELVTGWKRTLANLEYNVFYRPAFRAEARIVDRYCRRAGLPRGATMLDLGCGRALRLLEFRRLGYTVHGCDFQPLSVEYLNTQLKIPAKQGDVSRVDEMYEPESFDIVTAFHLMEHLLDIEHAFRACYRILKPGGVFTVCIPMADSAQGAVLGNKWAGFTEAPRHIALPSRKALPDLCRKVGFENVEFKSDDVLSCAAVVGLSVFPSGATTRTYGTGKAAAMFYRLLGAATSVLSIPWAIGDNYLWNRPAHGIVMGRKPK